MPLEIKIERTAFGGDGIGLINGKVCFVEGALPGETVLADVIQTKKNFLKAKTLEVLKSSPHRLAPPCPYIAHCGGCQYQHVAYEEELRLKYEQARELLQKSAGVSADLVKPMRYADKDYGYRNGVTLHRTLSVNKKPQHLGFMGRDNHSRIPIERCLLVDDRLSGLFQKKFQVPQDVEKVTFKISSDGRVISDQDEVFFRIKILEESIIAHSQGFFQTNLAVTELLIRQVTEWVERVKPSSFYDLFAGVGIFSLFAARHIPKIFCVEENKASIQALEMNQNERKLKSIEITPARVEKIFTELLKKDETRNKMVLLDPPRQGLSDDLVKFIAQSSEINSLIYVSCDPATLSRDLKIILSGGHFKVQEIVPFDMFPKTKHIELAVFLSFNQ